MTWAQMRCSGAPSDRSFRHCSIPPYVTEGSLQSKALPDLRSHASVRAGQQRPPTFPRGVVEVGRLRPIRRLVRDGDEPWDQAPSVTLTRDVDDSAERQVRLLRATERPVQASGGRAELDLAVVNRQPSRSEELRRIEVRPRGLQDEPDRIEDGRHSPSLARAPNVRSGAPADRSGGPDAHAILGDLSRGSLTPARPRTRCRAERRERH